MAVGALIEARAEADFYKDHQVAQGRQKGKYKDFLFNIEGEINLMFNYIPSDGRKRFIIMVFIILPILSVFGFLLGTKIAMAVFNFKINLAVNGR